jgi:hypothetical protein
VVQAVAKVQTLQQYLVSAYLVKETMVGLVLLTAVVVVLAQVHLLKMAEMDSHLQ